LLGVDIEPIFYASRREVVDIFHTVYGELEVVRIVRSESVVSDYDQYANLVALQTMYYVKKCMLSKAQVELEKLSKLFDGVGFADKPFKHRRAQHKLL